MRIQAAIPPTLGLSLLLGPLLGLAPPARRAWTFEDDPPGASPRGFERVEGRWEVAATADGRVLAQRASNPDKTFNVALVAGTEAADVAVSVRVRPVEGVEDRGGGLVWRAVDGRNYYVARFNPLEDNVRIYKVEGGVRTLFLDAPAPRRAGWRALRVVATGDRAEVYLDGVKRLDIRDATFPRAGRIGVWSKADARSEFDDLTCESLDAPGR